LYRPSRAAIRFRALAGLPWWNFGGSFWDRLWTIDGIAVEAARLAPGVQLRIRLRQGGHRLGGLRVIGDIGGTNARFALAQHGAYQHLLHVEVGQYASLHDALTAFIEGLPPSLRPSEAALAIAGPVFSDTIALTNHGWTFSISELKQRLELSSLVVMNDFAATALSVPYLRASDIFLVGPECAEARGPIGIIGPGTGLGVSSLIPAGEKWALVPGEGGHVTLAASTKQEDEIIGVLRARFEHVSAERVLSGAGLVNLYEALCSIAGVAAAPMTPADVTNHAICKTDATCVDAFTHFCRFLGTVASDLALTIGATGGIYIAGGILLRFKEAFAASPFRERFEDKGRFRGFLRGIPTRLILDESPALSGLANSPL
jgi:glucokinase